MAAFIIFVLKRLDFVQSFYQLKLSNLILKLWHWILDLGVSAAHSEENELIRMYNGMALLSASFTLAMSLFAYLSITIPEYYFWITIAIASNYVLILSAHFTGHIRFGRYVMSLGTPVWVGITNILIGGNFSQGTAIIAEMAITYVSYQDHPRTTRLIVAFSGLVFLSSIIYVGTFGPVLGVTEVPYDEIAVFLAGLGWTVILMYKFVKDRVQLVNDLKEKNQELQETTEELERFTHIASHDLKSPLRTIISFINLTERDLTREQYGRLRENLTFVRKGAEEIDFLIKGILDYAKLRQHDQQKMTPVDLNKVFAKVKQSLNEDIRERNAVVKAKHLPTLLGHEAELTLLFQNFIHNGIKYNKSLHPTVIVSWRKFADHLKLIFTDNGIGIEEQYHDQIFQFFERLHTANEYQGTGLGLGLCKKIIDSYGGEITVESMINKGTNFIITFPLSCEDKKPSSDKTPDGKMLV